MLRGKAGGRVKRTEKCGRLSTAWKYFKILTNGCVSMYQVNIIPRLPGYLTKVYANEAT